MELISREEVLGYLQCEVNFWKDEEEKVHKVVDIIKFEIEELPIIESRQKGKWLRITQGGMPEQYMCPFCRRTIATYGIEELLSTRYPYCHCGADMRGGTGPCDSNPTTKLSSGTEGI